MVKIMNTRQSVETLVIEVLSDMIGPADEKVLDRHLVNELKLIVMICPFYLQIDCKKNLRLKIPTDEWHNVATARDAINLLTSRMPSR